MIALTAEQSREVDRRANSEYGLAGIVLMENAGRCAAELATEMLGAATCRARPASVLILCGRGNNGGDGFVAARHLHNRGFRVSVVLLGRGSDLAGDAAANYAIVRRMAIELSEVGEIGPAAGRLAAADLVVDALLGTGLRGAVKEPFYSAISAMNASGRPILALDIPSGLDADTGRPLGIAVRAVRTITFVAPKVGLLAPAAREYLGELTVADIGVPKELVIELAGPCASGV